MHPTPAYLRKTVQLMMWLTILAWATQLLFASWARGADLPRAGRTQYAQLPVELGGSEKFVAVAGLTGGEFQFVTGVENRGKGADHRRGRGGVRPA